MALDWKFDQKTAGVTFLAVAAYQSSRGNSLPSLYDMQRERDSSVVATRVSQGKSLLDGLVLAAGAGFLTDSLWPVAGVLTMVLIDAVFYNWALHVSLVEVDDN